MKAGVVLVLMVVGGLAAGPARAQKSCQPPEAAASMPNLSLAGIDDPQALDDFLATLKAAVADHDDAALASAIDYPLDIYDSGKVVASYPDAASVLAAFDEVFSPRVLAAIRCSRASNVFVNDQGAMLGDGEVWLDGFDDDANAGGPIRIKAINP